MKKVLVLVLALALSPTVLIFGFPRYLALAQVTNDSNANLAQQMQPNPDIEQAILSEINQHRIEQGLGSLELDLFISEVAREHSRNMASSSVAFGHSGFNQRVQAITVQVPYAAIAENVAYSQGYRDVANQAVEGWLNSSRHRQNIEGDYGLTGIGVATNAQGEYYLTQIFARSR